MPAQIIKKNERDFFSRFCDCPFKSRRARDSRPETAKPTAAFNASLFREEALATHD
jgi:hypothetical protein